MNDRNDELKNAEDRIVEVLEDIYRWKDESEDDYHKRLAHEILKGQEWEVVGKGEVDGGILYEEHGFISIDRLGKRICDKHQGKQIEIAVRVIKEEVK